MSEVTDRIDAESLARFDEIIDVRTPAEFALDHVPGAVNLPVLSNAERAEVGTIYVQDSRLKARRIGAAYVARNIAAHLEGALKDRPGSYAPLVYCWRGGQRSEAMASVLAQIGWRPTRLVGGYKTYRRAITRALYDGEPLARLVLLDGYTGTSKTEILGRLAVLGVQTLDLEGLAHHRGSLFGGLGREQPSQKMFESRLLGELARLDRERPVVVEAESSKIGELMVPPVLWTAMARAPRIEIAAPREVRARYLLTAYEDLVADPAAVIAAIAALPGRHGRARIAAWQDLARAAEFPALVEALMEIHYDPAYERSRRQDQRPALGVLTLASLGPDDQDAAAGRIAEVVAGLGEAS
ncbi:MAG TPA: tRNA 2-selenouridine(34) synthase MnmH [Caulobacteraceae bacterium]|jgi:tRNA 2-selenouridine synthase